MILTDAERLKFIDYLDTCANDGEGIAKQMETLPGPAMAAMAKRERAIMAAYRIVANRLRDTQSMTLA